MAKKSEKSYSLTPQGIAWLALREAGINVSVDEPAFHSFWEKFVELLTRHGYSLPGIPVPEPIDLHDDNFIEHIVENAESVSGIKFVNQNPKG